MPAKRGDRVAPPARPDGWGLRFGTAEAAKGWDDCCREAQSNTWEAFVVLTTRPTAPEKPTVQYRLRGTLGTRTVHGRELEQWQYKVSGAGRIWYCPDESSRTVWIVYASMRHPKSTE